MQDRFKRLFPPNVVLVSADAMQTEEVLYPAEAAYIAQAVAKRRREFATGRWCARQALAQAGFGAAPILRGAQREPLWPAGVVGSITHTDGYCGAVVASRREYRGLGFDAESCRTLEAAVVALILQDAEREQWRGASDPNQYALLIFTAKESVYKACCSLAQAEIGFQDILIQPDMARGVFAAMVTGFADPVPGRFVLTAQHLFSAAWLGPAVAPAV